MKLKNVIMFTWNIVDMFTILLYNKDREKRRSPNFEGIDEVYLQTLTKPK